MADKKKAGLSNKEKMSIGVGLTAAAVATAGAFFLAGSKNAAKNRKVVKSWMLKAKAEVLEGLEKAQEMSQADYEALIEQVGAVYATAQSASKADISGFKKEMKDHWQKIAKSAAPKKKVAKKVATKVAAAAVKTATKKVAKKVTKKADDAA
jgi:6-phosphogluconolactonase (cycloisomerase 2 family)